MSHKTAKDYFDIPLIQKIGVYAIHNTVTDRYYIGSSSNVHQRMVQHANSIVKYGGVNMIMAEDIKGKRDFRNLKFMVLETFEDGTITDKELRDIEYSYMKKYESLSNGYNKHVPWATFGTDGDRVLVCEELIRKWEYVSFRLPKGTKKRIKNHGLSINGLINILVLAELDRLDEFELHKDKVLEEDIDEQEHEMIVDGMIEQETADAGRGMT